MSSDWIASVVDADELARTKEQLTNAYRAGGVDYLISQIAALSVLTRQLNDKTTIGVEDMKRRIDILEPAMRVMAANQVLPPESFADQVSLTAEMSLDENAGFYKLEYNRAGVAFRWTGPTEMSRITAYLNRDMPKTATVNICNFSLKNEVEVFPVIDGMRTKWASVTKLETFTSYTADLPKRETKMPTLIGFETSHIWRPSEQDPESRDERPLGVAFHSLIVS